MANLRHKGHVQFYPDGTVWKRNGPQHLFDHKAKGGFFEGHVRLVLLLICVDDGWMVVVGWGCCEENPFVIVFSYLAVRTAKYTCVSEHPTRLAIEPNHT